MEPASYYSFDFDEFRPSFSDLPMEIIVQIFNYLSPTDKILAAITCRRWFEAYNHPSFQKSIVLKFRKIFLSDSAPPLSVFLHSNRRFLNVYLDQTDLGSIEIFFKQYGKYIQEITFESIDATEKQFKTVIKELTNLKSLTIINCSALFMDGQFFESDNDMLMLQNAFANVKILSLESNRYLSDAIMARIAALTRKLKRLDMSGCQIAWHNGLHKRFYPAGRINQPSEAILTFQHIVKAIELHIGTLEELDLSKTLVSGPALGCLAELKEWNLKKLMLRSCTQLTHGGLTSLFRAQPNLTHLDLSSSSLVPGPSMAAIAEQLQQLEILKLSRCKMLNNDGAKMLENLKKLRVLDISYCDSLTSDGVANGIAKQRHFVLEELYLTAIDISEACIIQCSENLPNLRILDLGFCFNGVTDQSLQSIIKNLILLRVLNLEFCNYITDVALTGGEITSQAIDDTEMGNDEDSNTEEKQSVRLDEPSKFKISLRSRAEEEIVQDAKRKQFMYAMLEKKYAKANFGKRIGYSINHLKGLRSLNLRGCNKISDVSLKFGFEFNELRVLSLSDCQQISVLGIENLVENCPSIEDFYLSDCHSINDKAIEIITLKLKRLNLLNISGCTQLTDHSLDYIAINCKYLKKLSVYGCRQMCPEPSMRLSTLSSLKTVHMNSNTSSFDTADTFRIKLHPPPWNF